MEGTEAETAALTISCNVHPMGAIDSSQLAVQKDAASAKRSKQSMGHPNSLAAAYMLVQRCQATRPQVLPSSSTLLFPRWLQQAGRKIWFGYHGAGGATCAGLVGCSTLKCQPPKGIHLSTGRSAQQCPASRCIPRLSASPATHLRHSGSTLNSSGISLFLNLKGWRTRARQRPADVGTPYTAAERGGSWMGCWCA